jgi:selenocysteine lyase/cysteine desulfurase
MRRREFLIGSGVTLGAAACLRSPAARAAGSSAATAAAPAKPPGSWREVKAEFGQLDPKLAHFAGFFLASHPRAVREAIETHRRGLDDNPYEYIESNIGRFEPAVRQAAADYFGGASDDYALTDSTTMGLGLVYGGLQLKPGQEILSTAHDHASTFIACDLRAERNGTPVRRVALYDNQDPARADADAIVKTLADAVRPETRVVAVTWVHSGTGVKLPIRRLAEAIARKNAGRAEADRALLCVDGVHGFGIEDVRADDLGCDFFIAGCHKWIFGPRGTGLVWAKPGAWPAIRPSTCSFDVMWRKGELPASSAMTPGGFHSFEHRWALEAAFRFHLGLGKARVAARIHELNRHLKAELARIPRVRVMTPASDELAAGINCFLIDGRTPPQVVQALRQRNVVASVTPGFYKPPYARLSAGLLTLEEDVDAALAAVRGVAA